MEERYQTLGENVTPVNYNITFDTNMKTFRFNGSEKVSVRIRRATRRILLNAIELNVLHASVKSKEEVQTAKVTKDKKKKRIALNLAKPVSGSAIISIEFVGTNNDKLYGFYRSQYDDKGRKNYILTSQFEAAYARTAFPCFDEPAFKATFDISMIIDNDLEAVSNMPVKSISRYEKDRKMVTFQTTPVMSSYLLYLGVGKYERVSSNLGRVKVNVLTTPGKKALANLPLGYAKKFLAFYNEYFGIGYPLPKMDLLAIPDFSAGAMENWGAVTFREIALLGDEKSAVSVRQRIAEVIAHELAHQWFGDLVTMRWWNDIWLNESFATFMSYKAMDAVFPEWDMKTQYFDDTIATAFTADSVKSTHPISVHISTPEGIESLFDEISYEKGGTVLHMLENYAGPETFRNGLHIHLKRHEYGNATKYDLWSAIDEAAKKRGGKANITKVANRWIDEPGYPIVNVRQNGERLSLEQKRFMILDERLPKRQVWPIPIYYVSEEQSKPQFMLLDGQQGSLNANGSEWAKLNYGQHYLYRVRYPENMRAGLGEQIKKRRIKGTDSWGIENDLFVLARSGRITMKEYMSFIEQYCLGDIDYPMNMGISSHLGWFDLILSGKKEHYALNRLIIRYNKRILERLGWHKRKGDDNITVMLRSAAISSLGRAGHKPTIKKALRLYNDFMHGKAIEPDLKSAVIGIAAYTGDAKRYKQMVERYKKEKAPDDKRRFLQSLALFRERKLILEGLKFSYTKDVRLQDAYTIPAIASGNPVGKEMIWDWTRNNWKFLLKTHDVGTHMLDRFVENLSGAYTPERRKEIAAFFGKRQNVREDIKRTISQTLERIDANINFMKANGLEKSS